jgi:hypothetical protein
MSIKEGRFSMRFEKRKCIVFIFIVLSASPLCVAQDASHYVWDSELDKLPIQQREFIEDIVTAFRTSDISLGKSRIHSTVLKNRECSTRFFRIFEMSTIKEQFAVKVKAGKKPNSLHFSIRHQNRGEDGKRDFMKLKNVVEENGKLVININCKP